MSDYEYPHTFQLMQVLSDLRSAAAAGIPSLTGRLSDTSVAALKRVVFEQECKLAERDLESLHGELMMIASMPDQNHPDFMTATILLLSDRLQYGAGEDDLVWNWRAFQERFREAPSPVRAALMNGFRCAHEMKLVELDRPPTGRDFGTYDEEDLIRLLKIIARRMTEDVRDKLCFLAPAETRIVHRKALENCLKSSCVLSEFGGWFPGEVVEMASLDTEHPAYSACTALLLIDAIVTGDAKGRMAWRYEELAEEYFAMQQEVRVPLVAALRHLHEMEAEWQPYSSWAPEVRLNKAIVMPFARA